MQEIIRNKVVNTDLKEVYQSELIDWEVFRNKIFYITGATGVIGSFLIRCLKSASENFGLNLKLVAGVRDIKRAKEFFLDCPDYKFVQSDVLEPIKYKGKIDYIIHCANNTSSKSFVENPSETFNVAASGTKNVLDFAKEKKAESVIFLSSMEVYGNIEEAKPLKENELGNLDENNPRSSYPLGKRRAEELCYNYAKEHNVPVKVLRLAQIIGSNVDYDDSRVYAQFARSIVEKKDIVLNTKAETTRSYCYITDLITAILTVLTKGKNGECYNVANENAVIKIKDMAKMLTDKYEASNLVFDIKENTPYFKETHWVLDNEKLKSLNWSALVDINEMYNKLISSFYSQIQKNESSQIEIKQGKDCPKDSFLEQIFSVKNTENHKIIKILGIKIKLNKSIFLKNYCKLPIQENKIVFSNYMGNGYGCNPKYIAEEIIKRKLDYNLIWLAKDSADVKDIPNCFRIVKYNSLQALKELTTAKVWINNYHKIAMLKKGLKKREGQIYIQTWHGSLGIKKIEKQVDCLTKNKTWENYAIENSKMTDFWISNSDFETFVYEDSFWGVKNIKEFGHPRNDIFFKDNKDIKEKVRKFYKIEDDKNILLYAPSFREDESLKYYQIDYRTLQETLENRTNQKWTILVRLHPRVAKFSKYLLKNETNVIDASSYTDIQELLISSDIMITDYSSCIFDFMLSKKPAYIYANDIDDYNQERGFYFPLKSTPFPVATTNLELIENIKNFDYDKYKTDVEEFLKDKGCVEDGHASERVVNLIEEIIDAKRI